MQCAQVFFAVRQLVPAITKNLMYVIQFARDNKVFFEFHVDKCFVKTHSNSEVLLQGLLNKDGLYIFDSIQLNPSPEIAVNNISRVSTSFTSLVFTSAAAGFSPYLIWHNMLGHSNHEALKTILQLYNIYVPHKYVLDFCSSCCLGKIHRLPSISSHTIYTNPFDILFVDV